MPQSIHDLLNLYNPDAALDRAYTIPAPWYRDPAIESLERWRIQEQCSHAVILQGTLAIPFFGQVGNPVTGRTRLPHY